MSWKHFYLINPETKTDSYCVNSYGALNSLDVMASKERQVYETVWLTYNEINEILTLKIKKEKYTLCDKLFKEKFPQEEKNQKELSKNEQSKLEKLFEELYLKNYPL